MKLILPISFLIISAIVFFSVVNPLYGEVSTLRTDVASYTVALNNSTNLQKTSDALIASYTKIDPKDKEKLDHFLPNTANNIRFVLEMEQIANMHNMPMKNINFEPQEPKDSTTGNGASVIASPDAKASLAYGVFPVEFTVEGSYDTFALFLKDIEDNLRLVDVKSVGFTVPVASADSKSTIDPNIYTFSLKVETYWLK